MTTKVTGSILANTAVTAGRYGGASTVATHTVDAQGRLIDSSNVAIAITSTNLDATGVTGTTYGGGVTSANHQVPIITVDTKGRITAASNVSVTNTSIYANTGQLIANASTGVVEIGLADTAVTAGRYGGANTVGTFTVDAKGRLINSSNATIAITSTNLDTTGVSAGRYGGASTVATHTVDAQGRLIDSSNVAIAITSTNLDATGVTGTTYGGGVSSSNFQLPVVTVDTKGRITAASNVTVTSTAIYANTGQLVANAATGVVQIGLATSGANPGNYGSGTTTPVIQVDALGRITSVSSVLITGGSAGTGSTTFNRTTVTATAGQTLFSSIPHTTGYLQVHLNGVLLTPNDYTANASNSAVVLTQACSVGDQFDAFAYTTTLANNLSPGTTGGSAGVILYQSSANTTSNTIVGTNGQVLTSAGTGQPTWTTLATSATTDTTNANNITSGTVATARLSGSYTGITGVGTLAAGSIPSTLITGLTVGSTANTQTFNSTGTWYKPSGVSMAKIQVWAGGGGSGRNGGASCGGGGGAYSEITVPVSYLAATVTATVGTGGSAGGSNNVAGGVGGTSSFPLSTAYNSISTITAYGGGGGMAVPGGGGGGGGGGSLGAGGSGANSGNSPVPGAPGNGAAKASTVADPAGTFGGYDGGGLGGDGNQDIVSRNSVYGGGGGSEGSTIGGGSVYGGGGGSGGGPVGISLYGGSGGAAGSAGTVPGGGGGASGGAGGAGAAGRIIVFCW